MGPPVLSGRDPPMVVVPRAPLGLAGVQARGVVVAAGSTGGAPPVRPGTEPRCHARGAAGAAVVGVRRTTVRGGSTAHAAGSAGAPAAVEGATGAGPRAASGLDASASAASALADSEEPPPHGPDEGAADEGAADEAARGGLRDDEVVGDQAAGGAAEACPVGRQAPGSPARRTGERGPGRCDVLPGRCCVPVVPVVPLVVVIERRTVVATGALGRAASAPDAGAATGAPALMPVAGLTGTGASSATV
ncbi:hypothetical protein [Cellulomonas gelida]|nr:hypothetical protein [Cellulomonas gelida]